MPPIPRTPRPFLAALSLTAILVASAGLALVDPGSTQAHHLCGNTGSPYGAFDLQTYEDANYKNSYARAFELAGYNQLLHDRPSFQLPLLESGPRSAGSGQRVSPYIPPVLLKSIAWLESSWAQANYEVPYGSVGPVLSSHDCGYGIMQITSGMQNVTGVPNLDQAMIGGHYAFNIARGARILAEKWNGAPEFRPQVGNRTPQVIEDWYYAIWSYNGFARKNHPLNELYDPNRQPYRCDGSQPRSAYPYQELVIGCVNNPPLRGGVQLWAPQPVTLPNLSDPAFGGPLSLANWDACSQQLQCAAMDFTTPSPWHTDPIGPPVPREQVIGVPTVALSHRSISLVAQPGGQSTNQAFALGNSSNGVLPWKLTTSAPWVRLSRIQGVSLGADLGYLHQVVTVSADASSLLPGTHTARINVESLYAVGAGTTIDVTVETTDGALISTPDGRVYLLQGGLKRHVPDPATFEAHGYAGRRIIPVTSEWANGVPTGHPLPSVMANGRLIRPPGGSVPIYVMENGAKRHIASPDIFPQCGYAWDSVAVISTETLNSIATGSSLSSPPCPRVTFVDGTLLESTDGLVWVLRGGMRRWITGPGVLADCSYAWGNVTRVPVGFMAQFPAGPPLTGCTSEGSLLLTPDGKVNVVLAGKAHLIPDAATFQAYGYDSGRITPVSAVLVPVAQPVMSVFTTGSLIRPIGDNVPIYVIDGGKRRHIASPGIFAACGYSWQAVAVISPSTLDAIPAGPALAGPPCPRLSLADGTLIYSPNGAVFVTIGQARKWVLSPATISDCRYEIANLIPISAYLIAQFAVSDPVNSCTSGGSLLYHDGKVYLVRAGVKRHVPNPHTFDAARLSWSAITPLQQDLLPTGKPLLDVVASGRLIRPSGDNVPIYVMESGYKRHIQTPSVLDSCGYSWAAVSELPPQTVASLASGPPLQSPPCPQPSFSDGTLLWGSDGKVWVMQSGQRRWVYGPAVFAACGYLWGNMNTVADSIINAQPAGANLTGAPCPQ